MLRLRYKEHTADAHDMDHTCDHMLASRCMRRSALYVHIAATHHDALGALRTNHALQKQTRRRHTRECSFERVSNASASLCSLCMIES